MKIKVSSICDTGLKREVNQDAILTYDDAEKGIALFLVADGMGGHTNGEKASHAITDGIQDWLENAEPEQDLMPQMQELCAKLQEIHKTIFEEWNQEEVCGSTCVLLLLKNKCYGFLSVGDSRLYMVRGLHCTQMTADDIWENQKNIQDSYTEEERKKHPNYGRLIHAVGSSESLVYTLQTDTLRKGDVFALCSDGVYKLCGPKFLRRKLWTCRFRDLDKVRDKIIGKVYKNGAKDNASLILVRVEEEK